MHERLTLYKRLANCESGEQLQQMQEELIDRFGELPEQARALLETHRLRIVAKPLGIAKIDATASQIQLHFVPDPPIDPVRIIQLIQKNRNFKLAGPDRLLVKREAASLRERAAGVRELIHSLSADSPVPSATTTT